MRPDPRALEGVDAVVHLAGASIAGRFTDAHKRLVRDSRVGPTAAAGPGHGRACPTGRASSSARRRSGTTGPIEATRCSPRTAGAARGSWPSSSRTGRRRRSRRPRRACESCTCGPASSSPPAGRASSCFARSSRLGTRRAARSGIAVGLVDRPRRPARRLRACARRRRCGRPAQRGGARARDQQATTPPRWPASCGAPRSLPVPAFGPRLLLGAEGAREMVQASQRVTPARLGGLGPRLPPSGSRSVPAPSARSHRVAPRARRRDPPEPGPDRTLASTRGSALQSWR